MGSYFIIILYGVFTFFLYRLLVFNRELSTQDNAFYGIFFFYLPRQPADRDHRAAHWGPEDTIPQCQHCTQYLSSVESPQMQMSAMMHLPFCKNQPFGSFPNYSTVEM